MKCYVERQGGFVRYEVRDCGVGEGWELFLSEHREEEGINFLYERDIETAVVKKLRSPGKRRVSR